MYKCKICENVEFNNYTSLSRHMVRTHNPEEIRKSRKFGGHTNFWLRNYIFENSNDKRRIELWTIEKESF